jgi:hypothetical protein
MPVARVTELSATSDQSFEDAINQAIKPAYRIGPRGGFPAGWKISLYTKGRDHDSPGPVSAIAHDLISLEMN